MSQNTPRNTLYQNAGDEFRNWVNRAYPLNIDSFGVQEISLYETSQNDLNPEASTPECWVYRGVESDVRDVRKDVTDCVDAFKLMRR